MEWKKLLILLAILGLMAFTAGCTRDFFPLAKSTECSTVEVTQDMASKTPQEICEANTPGSLNLGALRVKKAKTMLEFVTASSENSLKAEAMETFVPVDVQLVDKDFDISDISTEAKLENGKYYTTGYSLICCKIPIPTE